MRVECLEQKPRVQLYYYRFWKKENGLTIYFIDLCDTILVNIKCAVFARAISQNGLIVRVANLTTYHSIIIVGLELRGNYKPLNYVNFI